MKYLLIILLAATVFIACKDKKDKTGNETSTTAQTTTAGAVTDSAAIRSVILDFYNWYDKNYKKFMAYNLYSSIKNNNAAPYKFNWEAADKYQAFIRDSVPQLGDEFLVNQKIMFKKADSAFKVDVKDDVPVYFDFDWYTNSQEEPSYLLNGLNKSNKWIIDVKGDNATVEIGAPEDKDYVSGSLLLFVGLKKENGAWTISRIGND